MCDLCEIFGDIACGDVGTGLCEFLVDCASSLIDVIGACTDTSKNRRDPPGGGA